MQTLTEIRSLLLARGVRPKHRLGQNFLHDHNVLRKLVDAAGVIDATPAPAPLILEIGPGTGALTEVLLDRGARVIACEIDRAMIEILRDRVMPRAGGRLTIVEGDCLDGKHALSPALRMALSEERVPEKVTGTFSDEKVPVTFSGTLSLPQFRLVANLPYGSATPLIATLLANHPECRGLFATIQREVADRLLAAPRSDAYGPLSVTASLLARVQRVMEVSQGCFWPAPEVTSAIVAIHPFEVESRPAPLRTLAGLHAFERFVGSVFSKRRKQLGAILGRAHALPVGIEARQRPEELAPLQWLDLWLLSAPPDVDTPCE